MEPLYKSLETAGLKDEDVTEGYGTQVELSKFVNLMNSYDVTADPANERYLLQDDQHQYTVSIMNLDIDNDIAIVTADYNRFAKEDLENVNILSDEDFIQNPQDEAIFGEGSNALDYASRRIPENNEKTVNDGEILEPKIETGWGFVDK